MQFHSSANRQLLAVGDDQGTVHVQRDSVTGSAGMWTNRPLADRPGWPLGPGVDILAPAGSLIIQNNNNKFEEF